MFKYLNIIIGIYLIASSAHGAEKQMKINKPQNLGELTVEEKWIPGQTFEIREKFSGDHGKNLKSKSTINIWQSERISIPLKFKIKSFDIPKVRLTFKATF